MTVSSLWKVLDNAGCGINVGLREILNPQLIGVPKERDLNGVNPWNVNKHQQQRQSQQLSQANSLAQSKITLAVDLSIWICESLTSQASSENHHSPALHLVFTRTVKLLSHGIKLVFVVEGKRRVRSEVGDEDNLRKRRSGTAFWKACHDCKAMLTTLGVPVVQAKAEGEALCALLNQRGVVNGVISNDGDCLLFGAEMVFTRFSLENMEKSQVVCYNANKLLAQIRESDAEDLAANEVGTLILSRDDLISFALLTGSDLAGSGLPKVGHFKAIRFIRKCQLDNPLYTGAAALRELKSWEKVAPDYSRHTFSCTVIDNQQAQAEPPGKVDQEGAKKTPCCSRCCHPGNKRSHEKHGCEKCGTEPGEPCWLVDTEDRFRKGLRAKALALTPTFEPSRVIEAYRHPNDNQMPLKLKDCTAATLHMGSPNLQKLLDMKVVIKGRNLARSQRFVTQIVGRLLSRIEMVRICQGEEQLKVAAQAASTGEGAPVKFSKDRPIPLGIVKAVTKKEVPFYEVSWKVGATFSDDEGNGINGYEYTTLEPQQLVKDSFPKLVQKFAEEEKERLKQGDGEQERRREFLESLAIDVDAPPEEEQGPKEHNQLIKSPSKRRGFSTKQREAFFQKRNVLHPRALLRGAKQGDEAGLLFRCAGALAGMGQKQRPKLRNQAHEKPQVSTPSSLTTATDDPFLNSKVSGLKAAILDRCRRSAVDKPGCVPKFIRVRALMTKPMHARKAGMGQHKEAIQIVDSGEHKNHQCPPAEDSIMTFSPPSSIDTKMSDPFLRPGAKRDRCQVLRKKQHSSNNHLERGDAQDKGAASPPTMKRRLSKQGDVIAMPVLPPTPTKKDSLTDPNGHKTYCQMGGLAILMSPITSPRRAEPAHCRLDCFSPQC